MASSTPISRLIAGLLLCVFVLGITPKKSLHDVLANHTDTSSPVSKASVPNSVQKAGFHCQLDNNVAESPFESTACTYIVLLPVHQVNYSESFVGQIQAASIFTSLRGPPAGC